MRAALRVLVDPPRSGALNMAIDDALLAGGGSDWTYTLRLYRWTRPTVSLGYAQRWREGFDPELARRRGVDLVRRRTGGRAVMHADELTYSIVGPAEHGPLAGGIHATYRAVAKGLAAGLQEMGAPVELVRARRRRIRPEEPGACFAVRSRYEIEADGRKLLGSAQRRASGRVLQHGSLPLSRPQSRLWEVLGASGAAAAGVAVGLEEMLGRRVRFEEVARRLSRTVAEALGLEPRIAVLSEVEARRAGAGARRYLDPAFTFRV